MTIDPAIAATLKVLGYTLRGVTDRCVLRVRDGQSWTIDVDARPVTIANGSHTAPLALELADADLAILGRGVPYRLVEEWIESGRIASSGAPETVDRFHKWVHAGGLSSGLYAELADGIQDPRFVFMNHGFLDAEEGEDFSFLAERDQPWKYAINLVRHVVDGVAMDGQRILDVGCGRGGACSYYARYHHPREVIGVDLVPQNVAFCRIAHDGVAVTFLQGDAQQLPFPDDRFDVVSNIESSHCYPSLERFFTEVRRVLRPGGVFCYTDNMKAGDDDPRTALLERLGGRILRRRNITHEVIAAGLRWRAESANFMSQMIDPNLNNESLVTQFTASLNGVPDIYEDGTLIYVSWQVQFDKERRRPAG
jgi:ubiquinone/menaquinone biosynthesis C-methylase UbiE